MVIYQFAFLIVCIFETSRILCILSIILISIMLSYEISISDSTWDVRNSRLIVIKRGKFPLPDPSLVRDLHMVILVDAVIEAQGILGDINNLSLTHIILLFPI